VVTAPARRGFGSTIIEQSIPYDLGGQAELHYHAGGFNAQFCIPSRHVAGIAGPAGEAAQVSATSAGESPLAGKTVLLVEDSMIIALDAEDALDSLGAEKVTTAGSVARALHAIAENSFDFALLDVNLGADTSIKVADALKAKSVPFLFATGYGDSTNLLADHPQAPVITKPYGMPQLRDALGKLKLG
jgi:CheY-like chemotaxis protein